MGPVTSQRPEHVVGVGLARVGGMATQGPRRGQEAWLPTPSCPLAHPATPQGLGCSPGAPKPWSPPTRNQKPRAMPWVPTSSELQALVFQRGGLSPQACRAPEPADAEHVRGQSSPGALLDPWPLGQSHQGGTPSTPLSLPHVTVEHPPRARLCSGCRGIPGTAWREGCSALRD